MTLSGRLLLNFISATLVGVALLLPLGRIARRFAAAIRALLALSGIAIAASSADRTVDRRELESLRLHRLRLSAHNHRGDSPPRRSRSRR
jgi:hypothetical protein